MRILIAEDEPIARLLLKQTLIDWGHEVIETVDGDQAWQVLESANAPQLAILDWMMPGKDGVEICRQLRQSLPQRSIHVILLTSKGELAEVVAGLQAGADDYVVKPFEPAELQARVQVGMRVVELQSELAGRVRELEDALAHVKQLQGLLPICCCCKKIRDDQDYWHEVEDYISERTNIFFSHGYCPACLEKALIQFAEMKRQANVRR